MAPDLLWNDVRALSDPALMGSLPDLCVPETSIEDGRHRLRRCARYPADQYA